VVDQNVVHDGLGNETYEQAFYLENSTTSYTGSITWTRNVVYGTGATQAFQCQDAGGPVTCYVYNNTVYAGAVGVYGGAVNYPVSVYVENNIFDTPIARQGSGYVTWDYNDEVQANTIGPHDMHVSPQYVNAGALNFQLQSTSPVIDKGTNVGLPMTGSAPDLGAFEYGM
jgi:hypothetical protein